MTHYDEKYWNFQAPIGKIGGILNKFKFDEHINPTDTVLDFGCGGGFLLDQITASRKIGYDINETARENAKRLGIETVDDLNKLENNTVDVVISNHALEHVHHPLTNLQNLYRVVKPNGLIVIVVPYEQPHEHEFRYKENDVNQHLHAWNPQTLGNIVKLAGFKIIKSNTIQHKWAHDYEKCYNDSDFHQRCKQNAIDSGNYQTKCVAIKL